jgi:hypothetical protein
VKIVLSHGAALLLGEAEVNPLDLAAQYLSDGIGIFPLREGRQILLSTNCDGWEQFLAMRATVTIDRPLGSRIEMLPGSQVVITSGAVAAMWGNSEQQRCDPLNYLTRHLYGDWGEVDAEDKRANDQDSAAGGGALSAYHLPSGVRIWVDTPYHRQITTILLPAEY